MSSRPSRSHTAPERLTFAAPAKASKRGKSKSASPKKAGKSKSPKGTKGGKKAKKAKDPNAPKRPLSAFMLFAGDRRGDVKKAHPDWGVPDIGRELGRLWKSASASDKKKFEDAAAKAKAAYNKQVGK